MPGATRFDTDGAVITPGLFCSYLASAALSEPWFPYSCSEFGVANTNR